MPRKFRIDGADWIAEPSASSSAAPADARSRIRVLFTRLSDGFQMSETVDAASFDSATDADLTAGVRKGFGGSSRR
jgi:hypothetical protein